MFSILGRIRVTILAQRCGVALETFSFRSISSAASAPNKNSISPRLFKEDLNVLYDGKCSLCLLEISMIAKMDYKGKLKFTDIEDINFDPSKPENGHISYEIALANIHAVTASGEILVGIPVFSAMYSAVGMGFLFAFTKYTFFKNIMDRAYSVFAKYRTFLSRGRDMNSIIEERNLLIMQKLKDQQTATGTSSDHRQDCKVTPEIRTADRCRQIKSLLA